MIRYWWWISCVLMVIVQGVPAQETYFNRVYDFPKGSCSAANVELHDLGFISSSGILDSNFSEGIRYTINTKKGDLIIDKNYPFPRFAVRNGDLVRYSNESYFDWKTIQFEDTAKQLFSYSLLIRLNAQGDTIWTQKYSYPGYDNFISTSISVTPDSNLVLLGFIFRNNDYDPVLMKVDSTGKELWRETYNTHGKSGLFGISNLSNLGYVLSGYTPSKSAIGKFAGWALRVDNSGKVVWDKQYHESGINTGMRNLFLSDGNILLFGDTLVRQEGWKSISRKYVLKIDTSGQILWKKGYDTEGVNYAYTKALESANGDLLLMSYEDGDSTGVRASLTRLNSLGDSIWMSRYAYRNFEDQNYLWDFLQADDGGFVLSGDAVHDKQELWLVKTDSNGCSSASCESRVYDVRIVGQKEHVVNENWTLFPNPTDGKLQLKSHQSVQGKTEFELYDSFGRPVDVPNLQNETGLTLDLTGLTSGVYFLRWREGVSQDYLTERIWLR